MTDRAVTSARRTALEAEIRERLGLVPAFFRAVSSVEVAEQLWGQARGAYVDSPIPFAFREALFTYLSRFCPVPYCMLRHAAFLMRRGGPGRDLSTRPPTAAEVLQLLQEPMPTPAEIRGHLETLARSRPVEAWPEDRTGPLGEALFRCSVQIFLGGRQAEGCHDALRRVLAPERYEQLIALLGFIRAAHAWAEAHPDLEFEADVEALLAEEPALRSWIDGYREVVAREGSKGRRIALELTREELEKAEALARTVLNTAPDAVVTVDEAGVITGVNAATTRLLGYEESELLGQNVRMLMPSPYAEEHDDYLERYVRTGEARIIGKGREVEARRKDGSVFPVRLAVGEAYFDGSRLFTGIIHDLSEVRDLERQLLQSQKLEAIGTLAGGIAHDFNNLLTSICGSSEILIDHLDPADRLARSARRIQRAADRATAITSRLLAFSRQQVTQRRVVDLNDVVRETGEILAHTLPEDLDKKLDLAGKPLYVRADASQVGQVLMNLVVNAADAMGEGGHLTVATGRRRDGRVALAVRDTGEGIPAERLGRIFDPFFTTKGPGKGTGLGLSVSRAIVREHGGEIEVESEVGRGTVFTLLLPEVEAPAEDVEEGDEIVRGESQGETLLLVEDDDIARELLVEVLEEAGYTVLAAADPAEALHRARGAAGPIDLLITDIVLPGMTGLQLAAEIRAQHPATSLLYMSGYTEQKLADRGGLGSDETFLRKPFGNAVLLQKVREVLDLAAD